MTWDEQEHQNIPSSVMLEPFCIWTVQPSLEVMAGAAEVCDGQISVKPKYSLLEAFTQEQANMLWVLLTQRHTLCSNCSTDPALWHQSAPSAAMRTLSDNYSAVLQWLIQSFIPLAVQAHQACPWMGVPDPFLILLIEQPQGWLCL